MCFIRHLKLARSTYNVVKRQAGMDQRAFILIFVMVTIIALGGFGFNAIRQATQPSPSPSPTPELKMQLVQQTPTPTPMPSGAADAQGIAQSLATPTPGSGQAPAQIIRSYAQFPGVYSASDLNSKAAIIQTDKGEIDIQIFTDSPKAASNFMFLASHQFYDGLKFHRVEDWVIQGGDPTGTGSGGPGYQFEDEPVTRQYTRGIVAMANAGPNTNGSQFFILKKDTPLPPNYTIFGQVVKGIEVADQIKVGDVIKSVHIANLTQ